MQDFRQLAVWRCGHKLALSIYQATESFPLDERPGITGQIRRAAVAIPTSIAGGCGRGGDLELTRHLQNAMGSASEVEYLLQLAHDLHYLANNDYIVLQQQTADVKHRLMLEINHLLTGYIAAMSEQDA